MSRVRNGRQVNAELLKVFYFVALFIVMTLATMRTLVKTGIAERLGDEHAKYAAIAIALTTSVLASLLWLRRRRN